MDISRIPIGVVIKQIIDEKRLKAVSIAAKLGITRQAVYQSYAKQELSEGELSRWAIALGVSKEDLESRRLITTASNNDKSDYLMEHLSGLEAQFKEFREQLQVKDMQIASLQRMLEMTLGKSEGVIKLKTTPVRKMYPEAGALEA